MIEIEKTLKKLFRQYPKAEDEPRLRSGKIPIGQLYKVIGDEGKQYLKKYIKKEATEKFSATKLRLFKLGHILEDYLLGLMKEGNKSVKIGDEQLTLENDFLKGKIDCTITDDSGKKYICDIKTMNDMNYGLLCNDLVPEHIRVQLLTYIWLWKETMNSPIENEAIILAYNKNDSRVKAYIIEYDNLFIKTYLMEAKRFYKQIGATK